MRNKRLCHATGFGFDSHSFGKGGVLVLGGIKCPGVPGLKGHSDGDALLHAVIDAFLGAASLGDIGELFPDTSEAFKGIASSKLLKQVVQKTKKAGFAPLHIDITVVAERPRLAPLKGAMRSSMARLTGLPVERINIKAKTPEGLCLFKDPGGILVWAVATLEPSRA